MTFLYKIVISIAKKYIDKVKQNETIQQKNSSIFKCRYAF